MINMENIKIDMHSYITALEEQNKSLLDDIDKLKSKVSNWMDKYTEVNEENKKLQSELKDKEWISVEDRLPNCWSQHNKDYASGYLLGYTKYKEVEVVQLWNNIEWESESNELDYITHWMPLPNQPK